MDNTGPTDVDVMALAESGTYFFAGTYGGGLFTSNKCDASWSAIDTGLRDDNVRSLAVSDPILIAGTRSGVSFHRLQGGS